MKKPTSNDDFPPPPGNLQNAYPEPNSSKISKNLPPQTISKPGRESLPSSLNSENEDSQKSLNNLSDLEGLLQDLDKASYYHRKSIAHSSTNNAHFNTSSTNIEQQQPASPPQTTKTTKNTKEEGTLKINMHNLSCMKSRHCY